MEHLLNFGNVIQGLKADSTLRYARKGWNATNQFISIQRPDENSKMRKPYLYIKPVDGELVPWLASQTDMLADDWYLVLENKEGEM